MSHIGEREPTPASFASITFTTATPPVVSHVNNCSVARTAAGDWNVTLGDQGIDAAHCVAVVSVDNGAIGMCSSVTHTSDTVKRVVTITATTSALANPSGGLVTVRFVKLPQMASTG